MNVQTKNNMKGFTIIEVVLVLAIAGLIFLMVFIALPALQRNQRDTARKNDVSIVAAAVTAYSSNNRGEFPEDAEELAGYLDDLSENTDAGSITIITEATDEETAEDAQIIVVEGVKCGESTADQALEDGTTRQFAVITRLEAGNGQQFCQTS